MSNVRLEINLTAGNAAFDDAPHAETARILRAMADAIAEGREGDFTLRDINGNKVGTGFFGCWTDEEADA